MSFHISRRSDGLALENHESRRLAEKAFWILTAHEVKNGRPLDYYVFTEKARSGQPAKEIPMADLTPPGELDLASWVYDALANVPKERLPYEPPTLKRYASLPSAPNPDITDD